MTEQVDRLALSLLMGEEPLALRRQLEAFGASAAVLDARAGGRCTAAEVQDARDTAKRELDRAARKAIRIIGEDDPEYPPLLLQVRDRPLVLYLKGRVEAIDCLAVIGARRADAPGLQLAERFGHALAAAGLGVVSGLAWGIDAAAHRGALAAPGYTVAVLGSGLNRIYPRDHAGLAERIIDAGGLLVSEYAIDAGPQKQRFPLRNRIIAGMALGVVVIQAGARSGSLITARLAAEYDRLLWVTPNRAGETLAEGITTLLRSGATAAGSPEDIIEDLAPIRGARSPARPKERKQPETPLEAALAGDGATFDEIIAKTGGRRDDLHAQLLQLQLKGGVILEYGGIYRLTGF